MNDKFIFFIKINFFKIKNPNNLYERKAIAQIIKGKNANNFDFLYFFQNNDKYIFFNLNL